MTSNPESNVLELMRALEESVKQAKEARSDELFQRLRARVAQCLMDEDPDRYPNLVAAGWIAGRIVRAMAGQEGVTDENDG